MEFTIARDEGSLIINPDDPKVRSFLTLSHREMIKSGRQTKLLNHKTPMYNIVTVQGSQPALISHQGFWQSLQKHLEMIGHTVIVRDVRPKILPDPNLRDAILGLRMWQSPWIIKGLLTGNSGLLGAPTRFGKSYGMTAICRAFPDARIVVTAPGVDLCDQLFEHFKEILPHRDVRGVYTGSKHKLQSPDITICSIDSLGKMDPDDTDILIIDEPHAVVSDSRMPRIAAFSKARKYGFGATLKGRFDQKDRLIEGLIGPVISNVTYLEAVAQGAIAPMKILLIKIPFSKDTIPGHRVDRATVYKRLLTQSSRTAALVHKLTHSVIPEDWQTMAFIQNEKQAEFYLEHAMPTEGTIAMAKRMKGKQRREVTDRIASGEILRILASNIYVQGVTFPDLRVVINLAGGGANTTAIQKPGRLLQTRPGKNYGVMIDFVFECRDEAADARTNPPYRGVVGECHARVKAYKEIGYDIHYVNSEEASELIRGAYDNC